MEVQASHIEGISNSISFQKNSCSSDPNSAYGRINVNNAISTNNSGNVMPRNAQVNQPQYSFSSLQTAGGQPPPAPDTRDINSGSMFTTQTPPSGDIITGKTVNGGGIFGNQGNNNSSTFNALQSNLFTPCTTSGSNIKTDFAKDCANDTSADRSIPEPECSGSGINLACSETGSNLGDDDKMDTGSVYSFRSDVDQGSSCTINGSQCSDSAGLNPAPSTPRRTKNGILLRDRSNRLPVADRVRQKRSTMQDMARPLKHWLYKHRENPYPNKADKQQLARESNMSLTQVSNWFANARRRLKNTVRNPEFSWETRIQQYNSHVQGNAELLSISSADSGGDSETEATSEKRKEIPVVDPARQVTPPDNQPRVPADSDMSGDVRSGLTSPVPTIQHKFKQSILHRYLNDSFEHSLQFRSPFENRSRNPSGSVGSHDFEDCSMSMSSRSSPLHEHSFDDVPEDLEQLAKQWEGQPKRAEDELYWKEISAALALTTLARSRYSKV